MPENIIWWVTQNLSQIKGFNYNYTAEEHQLSILQNKDYKARSDLAENKLDPVPFFIYYGAQFVKKIILLYINEMLKSNINQSRL